MTCQSNTVHCLAATLAAFIVSFATKNKTLTHMPWHCMGCHFPLDFRQMHSQMTHKEAFSEPPNSQAVASQVLSLLHFPPETDTQARATLCTGFLAASQELPHTSAVMKRFADFLVTPLWCCLSTRSVINRKFWSRNLRHRATATFES